LRWVQGLIGVFEVLDGLLFFLEKEVQRFEDMDETSLR
jgi:hypothetical protein